jgi:hypothetical protein
VDFGPIQGARYAERNGRKRENEAQNRPGGMVGEVRKLPHDHAKTRGNTHQRTKKIPNSDELGIVYWWWMVDHSKNLFSYSSVLGRK